MSWLSDVTGIDIDLIQAVNWAAGEIDQAADFIDNELDYAFGGRAEERANESRENASDLREGLRQRELGRDASAREKSRRLAFREGQVAQARIAIQVTAAGLTGSSVAINARGSVNRQVAGNTNLLNIGRQITEDVSNTQVEIQKELDEANRLDRVQGSADQTVGTIIDVGAAIVSGGASVPASVLSSSDANIAADAGRVSVPRGE